MSRRTIPEATVLVAMDMYASGIQVREIAREISVHEATITRWLTKYFFNNPATPGINYSK